MIVLQHLVPIVKPNYESNNNNNSINNNSINNNNNDSNTNQPLFHVANNFLSNKGMCQFLQRMSPSQIILHQLSGNTRKMSIYGKHFVHNPY